MDGIEGTIQLTRTAFHASPGINKVSEFAFHLECTVWANVHTDTAAGAERRIILERIGLVGIEHNGLQLVNKNNGDV
jgi:hypothetical protein